jgi:inhibitor of cysteine peptidase
MSVVALDVTSLVTEARVHIGDQLILRFQENPTTGYIWSLSSVVPSNVQISGDGYIQEGGGIGAGGKHQFRFICKSRINYDLQFELKRPWQPNSPVKTSIVRLHCS